MSIVNEIMPPQTKNNVDDLAEYFMQFREDAINGIEPKSVMMIDLNENDIFKHVLEEERVNFRPIVRKALIKAIQFYRTDDKSKREKLATVFKDMIIHITIPENIKIEDLRSSTHENKIITFKCEIGTIAKPETVSIVNQWYCGECEHSSSHRGSLSKVSCSNCESWMTFEKVLYSEDIQRDRKSVV